MTPSQLESKLFYAVKFIVRSLAIPDQIAVEAAEAATREIVRYQKSSQQGASLKEAHHQNAHEETRSSIGEGISGEAQSRSQID